MLGRTLKAIEVAVVTKVGETHVAASRQVCFERARRTTTVRLRWESITFARTPRNDNGTAESAAPRLRRGEYRWRVFTSWQSCDRGRAKKIASLSGSVSPRRLRRAEREGDFAGGVENSTLRVGRLTDAHAPRHAYYRIPWLIIIYLHASRWRQLIAPLLIIMFKLKLLILLSLISTKLQQCKMFYFLFLFFMDN